MISATFDLTAKNNKANQEFALNLYLPPFAKNKLSRDTEKAIKLIDVRKQLKKIRTNISIGTDQVEHLHLLLALIVSGLIKVSIELSVFAEKGAKQWQQFKLSVNFSQLTRLEKKHRKLLIKAADNVGHFHSKPMNTLSSIQFCRDPDYKATGEFGFTENQVDNQTASLSISGGGNQFSVFYAILITRINRLSVAEHLIQHDRLAIEIQCFFKRLLGEDDLAELQQHLQRALNKTASDIGDGLHIMDKQITLPIYNENNACRYINITPIINPTVFATTNSSIFYVKNQSVRFINIELGGTNPSNAGTAVGEVAGQNSRLQMSFPVSNKSYAQQIIASLNYKGCFFWTTSFKNKIINSLLSYENNPYSLSNHKKRSLLHNSVEKMIKNIQEQFNEIELHRESLSEEKKKELLIEKYNYFFKADKITPKDYIVWQKTLIKTLQSIGKLKIEFNPIIKEIKDQFEQQIYTKGGF
jgi:hypothetical protein